MRTLVLVAGLALVGCGGGPTASPVPTVVGAASFGCVDEAGTVSATAAQWYPAGGGGEFDTGNQPADNYNTAFLDAVEEAMVAALPGTGVRSGDAGAESMTYGGCASNRWVDMYDATSHYYFVAVWRPETRVDLSRHLDGSTFSTKGDRLLLGSSTQWPGRIVLAVAPDGTTARIWAPGDDRPSDDTLAAAAQAVLARVLALRD